MNHPLLATIASLDAALDVVAGVDPIYLTTTENTRHHPNGSTTFHRRT